MSYEPFAIADHALGLYTAKEPWLSPESAYRRIENARIFRGRTMKRTGYTLFGELGTVVSSESLGTTDSGKDFAAAGGGPDSTWIGVGARDIVPTGVAPSLYKLTIKIGTEAYVAEVLPAIWLFQQTRHVYGWASGLNLETGTTFGSPAGGVVFTRSESLLQPATTRGAWEIHLTTPPGSGLAITAEYEYVRGLPVMGIFRFTDSTGVEQLVALDTKRLWVYSLTEKRFVEARPIGNDVFDKGTAADFFHASVYLDKLVLNNRADPPRLWDPDLGHRLAPGDLTDFAGDKHELFSAYMALPFKGHLVYLRPNERGTDEGRRARWTPVAQLDLRPLDHANAPSKGTIQSAGLIGDKLIVFFDEGETFELKSTGDVPPFEWKKLRGTGNSLARMSTVPFGADKALTAGKTAIYVTDGLIAEKFKQDVIPDILLNEQDPSKAHLIVAQRMQAFREVWFTLTSPGETTANRMLAISEDSQACMIHNLPFNVLGEWNGDLADTWDGTDESWDELERTWDEHFLGLSFPLVLAGSADGRIYNAGSGYTDDGLGIKMVVESGRLNPFAKPGGSTWRKIRLGYIDIMATANPGVKLKVELMRDFDPLPYKRVEVDLAPDSPGKLKVIRRIHSGAIGLFHSFRIEESSDKRVEWDAIVLWVRPVGKSRTL